MIDDRNQKCYTAPSIVHHYAQLQALQPAEAMVLNLLKDRWADLAMLDIGVGGGRTTQHFAKRVADYTGVDYSADMIAACQKRFSAAPDTIRFSVCDARDMRQFADNSFDFILFSFNGIDSVSHADRVQIFAEISRVGKPGSYFFFSTHNLQGFERELSLRHQLSLNPLATYVNLVMLALLHVFNYPANLNQLKTANDAIVRDESHNFSLNTYYVRPQAQIHQLAADFRDIKVYSWKNDLEIMGEQELCANFDLWLYYLCVIK
jgi:ubiquinone/menaquinone biosynthesis C-methylase UbiE